MLVFFEMLHVQWAIIRPFRRLVGWYFPAKPTLSTEVSQEIIQIVIRCSIMCCIMPNLSKTERLFAMQI